MNEQPIRTAYDDTKRAYDRAEGLRRQLEDMEQARNTLSRQYNELTRTLTQQCALAEEDVDLEQHYVSIPTDMVRKCIERSAR